MGSHLGGPGQVEWGARFARERDNLHAAMAYALDTQNVDLAFGLFCRLPASHAQVNQLVVFDPAPLLALPGATEHPGSAVALMNAANNAADRGDARLALQLCDEALTTEQRLGPVPGAHLEIMSSAVRAGAAGGFALDEMVAHLVEGARRAQAEDLPGIAAFFFVAAAQFGSWVDPVAARQHATEALALARQSGAPGGIVFSLSVLAGALAADDPDEGRALLFEARELANTFGYENPTELLLANVAAARLGEWPTALRVARRLFAPPEPIGRHRAAIPGSGHGVLGTRPCPTPTRSRGDAAGRLRHHLSAPTVRRSTRRRQPPRLQSLQHHRFPWDGARRDDAVAHRSPRRRPPRGAARRGRGNGRSTGVHDTHAPISTSTSRMPATRSAERRSRVVVSGLCSGNPCRGSRVLRPTSA